MLDVRGHLAVPILLGVSHDVETTLQRMGPASEDAWPGGEPREFSGVETMPVRSALIVDDEALVAMAIAEYFRDLGVETLEAFDPREALTLLDQHPEIEALVTDVRMPFMNGPELVRRALEARPDLVVLFITGFAADGDLAGAGAWPVLYKPFDLSAIGPALQRAIALR